MLGRGARLLFERKAPYRHEPDLVGRIGYRELNYAAVPDGKPLDPAVAFRELPRVTTEFEAEPFDLVAEMPKFGWPTVVHLRWPRSDHAAGGGPHGSRR